MSDPGPGGNPFGFLGDLMKMFMTDGPLNWQIARQAALVASTGGELEPNVDPLARVRMEELMRIADLHVSDMTGLTAGGLVTVRAVTRAEWAYYTLDHYRTLFEGLAGALTSGAPPPVSTDDVEAGLLGSLPQVLGPFFLGAQAGTMCGHLARQAMGQYELPIPRPESPEIMVIPATVTGFASDWSLPEDDVRMWVCVSELAHHAVLQRPHVRARLQSLLEEFVRGFRVDPSALGMQLDQLDLGDPSSFPQLFSNPEAFLGAVTTPGQRDVEAKLESVVCAIEGYVDHVVDVVGHRLIGSYGPLTEALRRRRVTPSDADELIRELFGLELSQAAYDRGDRFVAGVLERAGEEGLARLWRSERELPTPAEIDAPGLWLERIDIADIAPE
jgi:putative hydrolase